MKPVNKLATADSVREALRSVVDPEVGMNIIDLGLVYRIDIAPDLVRVEMTMTSASCPMGDLIAERARAAVSAFEARTAWAVALRRVAWILIAVVGFGAVILCQATHANND